MYIPDTSAPLYGFGITYVTSVAEIPCTVQAACLYTVTMHSSTTVPAMTAFTAACICCKHAIWHALLLHMRTLHVTRAPDAPMILVHERGAPSWCIANMHVWQTNPIMYDACRPAGRALHRTSRQALPGGHYGHEVILRGMDPCLTNHPHGMLRYESHTIPFWERKKLFCKVVWLYSQTNILVYKYAVTMSP